MSAGASGAIFGIFGAVFAVNYRRRHTAHGRDGDARDGADHRAQRGRSTWCSARYLDWRAHLGGAIAGMASGSPSPFPGRESRQRLDRDRRGIAVDRWSSSRRWWCAPIRSATEPGLNFWTRLSLSTPFRGGSAMPIQVALPGPQVEPAAPHGRRRLDAPLEVHRPQQRAARRQVGDVPGVEIAEAIPQDQHAVDDHRRGDRRGAHRELVHDRLPSCDPRAAPARQRSRTRPSRP